MMQLHVPQPCNEDWNQMTPGEQGRYCSVCCKTVVDFTGMTDDEVKYFFINKKKEESVCGRFRNEQIHHIKIQLPYNISSISMPPWKRFLTACLLAFSSMLFSCNTSIDHDVTGEISLPQTESSAGEKANSLSLHIDTTIKPECYALMGDTVVMETSVTQGVTIVTPIENSIPEMPAAPLPAEVPDTSGKLIKGEVAIDTVINNNTTKADTGNKKMADCNYDGISL